MTPPSTAWRPEMIRDAELFVISEDVLVEVVGRIRRPDWSIEMRPLAYRSGDARQTVRSRVIGHAVEDATVPDVLAGKGATSPPGPGILGDDPQATVRALAGAAQDAARTVSDGDAVLPGGTTVQVELRRLTILRSLLAHEIAMHLGSRACPLTEEQARGLYELTEPEAEYWRVAGLFREPLTPVPEDVSWRDRFLMFTGRDPHPIVPH